MDEHAWMDRVGTAVATIEPRSWWRGVSQDSWWMVLSTNETNVDLLCLRPPQRHRWAQAGEVHSIRRDTFGWFLEPM